MGLRGPHKGSGGRPPKPLSEKLLTGNPGKRELKVLKVFPNLQAEEVPEPKDYLGSPQKNGENFTAKQIFVDVWNWLVARGCEQHVSPELIEHYAVTAARHVQCEKLISSTGFLAKNSQGLAIASPFIDISQSYLKQSLSIWMQIEQIVKENCSEKYSGTPNDDLMSQLLFN